MTYIYIYSWGHNIVFNSISKFSVIPYMAMFAIVYADGERKDR